MVNDDLEIENAGKQDHDMGNNIEELYSTSGDIKNEIEGEKLPCAVTDEGDINKSKNGGHNYNVLKIEAKDDIIVKNEMEDQTNLQRETCESMSIEGSTGEQMNTINKNEEQTENDQTDVKNEVVEQKASNGGVKVDKSAENVVEEGNLVKDVLGENTANGVEGQNPLRSVIEENPTGDGPAEKYNESDPKSTQFSTDAPSNESPPLDKVVPGGDEKMEEADNVSAENIVNDEPKEQGKEILLASPVTDENVKTIETAIKHEVDHSSLPSHQAATPSSLVRYLPAKTGDHSGYTPASQPLMPEGDDGTPEEQAAFMMEIGSFYREKAMDFKPPKFYGQPLNCLKLWRAVIRLGGYDRVTGSKLWRQVGESFHPPKTCTTVSWTFRIFYEKSLLEYERHKTQSGELQLPVAAAYEASGVDSEGNGYQGAGSGRAKRDSAARAMQGWHVQRLFGHGEVSEPVIKDKNISNMAKREKNVKTIGSLKQKRPNEVESSVKAARIETSKQLATTVVDVGPPADWVKINVRQTKDCFEVYALVPGLLREEVRVQSDPAGRLVITGQPEQVDNPWGITPFKKVISLPSRIDPLQTSAVVSLHGRLFVRVPFEQSNG